MNVLAFEQLRLPPPGPDGGRPRDVAVPLVDGVRLCERFDDLFPGVERSWIAPPSREWLGGATSIDGDPDLDGRAVLLDGDCGIADCCGLMARIEVTDDQVRWRDLFSRVADTPSGVAFTFDRASYEQALAGLAAP